VTGLAKSFTNSLNGDTIAPADIVIVGIKVVTSVVNGSSNTVSVFRNTGTGAGSISYAAKVDFATGTTPFSVSIGDLDGDGKADLAVANKGSSLSVLRNTSTGAGSISYAAKVDFETGTAPVSVSIGDLDGDGKADLVVANGSSNTVSVFRNTSTGAGAISYAAKVDFTTGTTPQSVSIGDLDGDGKADLVVGNYDSGTLSVLRNATCITPVFDHTVVDNTSCDDFNGSITLDNATPGAVTDYTFAWYIVSPGVDVLITNQTGASLTNIEPGFYIVVATNISNLCESSPITVEVTDGSDCVTALALNVGEAGEIQLNIYPSPSNQDYQFQ